MKYLRLVFFALGLSLFAVGAAEAQSDEELLNAISSATTEEALIAAITAAINGEVDTASDEFTNTVSARIQALGLTSIQVQNVFNSLASSLATAGQSPAQVAQVITNSGATPAQTASSLTVASNSNSFAASFNVQATQPPGSTGTPSGGTGGGAGGGVTLVQVTYQDGNQNCELTSLFEASCS